MQSDYGNMDGSRPLNASGVSQIGNFSSLQNTVFWLNSTFLFLAIVAVGLRFWSRRIKRMGLMINDIFATVALIVLIPFFAIIVYGLCTGMGRHIQHLKDPVEQIPHLYKLMIPLQILWSTINTLVKISMIDLYLRVFPAKRLRLASYVLLGMSCIYWLINLLFAFLNCRPFSFNWNRQLREGRCLDPQSGTLGFGTINLILDVAIIVLPLPYLYTLQLKLAKKLSLMAIFALGFVITAISAVRIKTIISSRAKDFPVGSSHIALWSLLETTLSVINCCLPIIQPALLAVRRSTTSLFTHITHAKNSKTSKDSSLPTHKFITLTMPTQTCGSPPGVGSPPSQRVSPKRQQSDLERGTDLTPQKQRRWKTSYFEEKTEVEPDNVSTHSSEASMSLSPLPANAKGITMQKSWTVEYGFKDGTGGSRECGGWD